MSDARLSEAIYRMIIGWILINTRNLLLNPYYLLLTSDSLPYNLKPETYNLKPIIPAIYADQFLPGGDVEFLFERINMMADPAVG